MPIHFNKLNNYINSKDFKKAKSKNFSERKHSELDDYEFKEVYFSRSFIKWELIKNWFKKFLP